jgi:hypothetical protein
VEIRILEADHITTDPEIMEILTTGPEIQGIMEILMADRVRATTLQADLRDPQYILIVREISISDLSRTVTGSKGRTGLGRL